jgi:hypothetical protein
MLAGASVDADTYVPILIGAAIGAIGSLVFILRRSVPVPEQEQRNSKSFAAQRRIAVKSVTTIYALIAWGCLAAALALGDVGFIVTTGAIAVVATLGLFIGWRYQAAHDDA